MTRILIPPADYKNSEPKYLPKGTLIDHHVDGSSWGKFLTGYEPKSSQGWFSSAFDQYYYDPDAPLEKGRIAP